MRCCETVAAVETTARRPTERARLAGASSGSLSVMLCIVSDSKGRFAPELQQRCNGSHV